ncbi:MAG: glycosyltransferase [Proteobacteria bacterium]|nr:glycosyltransferase [Pseudomonadota bacterium]
MSDSPLFVIVSGTPYHGVHRSARGIADALGKQRRVLFVDPPRSVLTRTNDQTTTSIENRSKIVQEETSVFRLAPVAPPGKDRPGIRSITKVATARQIRRGVRSLDATTWILFQQSAHRSVIGRTGEKLAIFHSSDDLSAGAGLLGLDAQSLEEAEMKAARDADLVLAVSPGLVERWAAAGVHAELFPNGVDAAAFADVDNTSAAPDVSLEGPIAGVVGTLSERLDMALLHAVADRMSLLLVGPESFRVDRSGFADLISRNNVQWVGQRPFDELPSYYRHMDLTLLPYTLSPFNQASFPLKSLEYLAAGRAVVSTPLRSVESLHAPGITFASSPAAFADSAVAMAAKRSWLSGELQTFATQHTWSRRSDRLIEIAEEYSNAI